MRDDFDPERSDVDFLVEFGPDATYGLRGDYFTLQGALAELLGRDVDLLTPDGLRNIFLKRILEDQRREFYAAA